MGTSPTRQLPDPAAAPVEGGKNSDGDRHVLVVDKARCRLYELYRAFFEPRPNALERRRGVDLGPALGRRCEPTGWTSADAAGLPIFPGLVRYDEAAAGASTTRSGSPFESTHDAWIHPASHCAGDTEPRRAADGPAAAAQGRLRHLRGITGVAQTIAVALKRYGLIVADNGSNWYFSGTSDRRWTDDNLNQLKAIPGSAFEVVQSAAPVQRC